MFTADVVIQAGIGIFAFCMLIAVVLFLFSNSDGDLRANLAEMTIVDAAKGKGWQKKREIFKPGYAGVDPCYYIAAYKKLRKQERLQTRVQNGIREYRLIA